MLGVAMSTAFGGHSVTLAPNVTYVLDGITGVAFFPSRLLLLWGIAVGLWLVFAGRRIADPGVAPAGA
jgi:hypothetical protein